MWRIITLTALLVMSAVVSADGMFAKLGRAVKPTLPYQRAVIAHRNGKETMVVESVLNGPPGNYAWIIPLPNPPSQIVPIYEHAFDRIDRMYRPDYDHFSPVWVTLLIGIFLLLCGFAVARNPTPKSALTAFFVGLFFIFAVGLLFPSYMQPRSGSAGNVTKVQSMHVGSYHVEIVRPTDPGAMETWMRKHDGTLTPDAASAVAEYVKEGWCFLVAKLDNVSGSGSPHPLGITFATSKAIYPMRLTGAQGNRVVVDLFVLADGTAAASPLVVWNSNRYVNHSRAGEKPEIGFTPLEAIAWNGCAVTRLRGEMGPDQMRQDIVIGSGPFEKQAIRVGDLKAFQLQALYMIVFGLGLGALAGGVIAGAFRAPKRAAMIAIVTCMCLGGGAAAYNVCTGVHTLEANLVRVPSRAGIYGAW